ncbi:hypothetical protein MVES_000376 [Malassezia vespertilionis]|uniref:alanine--glyoxylate transaminase n=1 Tax=Malassezia vespertilionis TaxID=2020962 RepID=A0A2N1JHD9_9BASI|nr:hypothetical protein MVES_000376 [Malassezia vespertilionis]
MTFHQEDHKLLMIPGPIEVADDVLYANAHAAVAHVSPQFVPVFGEVLQMLRKTVDAPSAQPIVVAGSGTMGWDMISLNVLQPGDDVLVLTTGYFGDAFADALRTYGVQVEQLRAPVGGRPGPDEIRAKLESKKFRAITITQVDTSTAVLSDIKAVSELVHQVSPETLVVVDGVCSVASEEIHMDAWGIDVIMTASQKGLGCPPGLCIVMAGPRAIQALESRKSPATYYLNWNRWIPVMKSYEAGTPIYFGTPPTNLIYALHQSLKTITEGPVSLQERYKMHREASKKVKDTIRSLGLKQLVSEELQASNGASNSMTAVCYPDGLGAADILPKMAQRDIVFGAGLLKDYKDKYFRIGHMGH